MSSLTSFLLPDQEMVNWANKEMAIAESKDPPFRPYLAQRLTESPWIPADSDHTASRTKWVSYSKQAKRTLPPKVVRIQALVIYRLRFLFAADLCSTWAKFVGLVPQLAHLSTVLHIGIAESAGASLSYRRIAGARLQGEISRAYDLCG